MTRWSAITRTRGPRSALAYGSRSTTAAEDNLNRLVHHESGRYFASTLDYTTFEPREFIAQNDKVVSLVYSEATVRDTGRAFVNPEAHVWTIRDGKLARFQSYHDTAAAAAAHRVE